MTRPPHGWTVTRQSGVAELVLESPAVDASMWAALPDLLADVDADPQVRVLVVRGSGENFCAGADIRDFAGGLDERAARETHERTERATAALAALQTPSIAMVQGFCIGGGCALALCCDFRVASEGATFAITPAKLGLVYSFTSTRRLVQAVGSGYATYLLVSGDRVDAAEALRARLVDKVVPDGDLATTVAGLAGRIAQRSQFSQRSAKSIIAKISGGAVSPDDESEALVVAALCGPDMAEGVQAFLEKRPPTFARSPGTA